MSKGAVLARADLARTFAEGIQDEKVVAEALGYLKREENAKKDEPSGSASTPPSSGVEKKGPTFQSYSPVSIPFFIPGKVSLFERRPPPPVFSSTGDATWAGRPSDIPPMPPLGKVDELSAKLRKLLFREAFNADIDLDKAVERIAGGLSLGRPPMRKTRRWGQRIRVILDRRPHLLPIHADQDRVVRMVRALAGNSQVDIVLFDALSGCFRNPGTGDIAQIEGSEEVWLALTDFGVFSGEEEKCAPWRALSDALGHERAVALITAPRSLVPPSILSRWRTEEWEDRDAARGATMAQVDRLLTLLSPCTLVAAGMIRALRLVLDDAGGVAVEHAVLQHPDLALQGAVVSEFQPGRRKALLKAFEAKPEEDRRKALGVIRAWRIGRPDLWSFGVRGEDRWFAELLDLSDASRALSPRPADVEDARAWFAERARRAAGDGPPLSLAARAHLSRIGGQVESAWRETAFAQAVWSVKGVEGYTPPPDADSDTLALTTASIGRAAIGQRGSSLTISTETEAAPLALLPSDDGIVTILPSEDGPFAMVPADAALPAPLTPFRDRLADGTPGPEMVSIPTGSFLMGSPEDEEDRFSDEGPQHRVKISQPFALAKYPVTFQEFDRFCEATGRKKPADMGWGRGRRPVIDVSWNDAQAYCDWLSAQTGEVYRLPSEAEWEYACRAGATTRYWWGDEWDATRANGPEGDKTSEVDSYSPNPWGLHDMHGNVWEWCEDQWQGDYNAPRTQAAFQSSSGGSDRVIRDGSWDGPARLCRSAYRGRLAPGTRRANLGFRPARGQAPGAPASRQGTAERAGLRAGEAGKAEPPAARREGPPSQGDGESDFLRAEPVRCRVKPGGSASIPLAKLPPAPFVIRTDRAELVIQRITRSDLGRWASGMGRDRFGLWAEFALGDIRQRLRFCPPGRFWMGSPADEVGRYDDEGPQTEITFTQGFWMFDTPVTQDLYEAVTGKPNPSQFVSPTRPVEGVSWDDAQAFILSLNDRFPHASGEDDGLSFILPSEAQWEYACRAGTQEATYAGPMEILGAHNAPVLNDIAWYGGNSGKDFELEDGYDSSDWRDKQFEHSKAGTMPVKLKDANPWGLYDMIGNVWEWCEDAWHDSHEGASLAGLPRHASQQDSKSIRVIRGGSWDDVARFCRSAYRDGIAPDDRLDLLGFRPARGQAPGAQAGRKETAERSGLRAGEAGKAEPPAERGEGQPSQRDGESIFSRARNMLGLGRKED